MTPDKFLEVVQDISKLICDPRDVKAVQTTAAVRDCSRALRRLVGSSQLGGIVYGGQLAVLAEADFVCAIN